MTNNAIGIIEANREKLIETITACYRLVLESDGRIIYKVYIWDDGEIELLQDVSKSSWLQPRDCEKRALYEVCVVEQPNFDWTVYWNDPYGMDNLTEEQARDIAIDFFVDMFDAEPLIDESIEWFERRD